MFMVHKRVTSSNFLLVMKAARTLFLHLQKVMQIKQPDSKLLTYSVLISSFSFFRQPLIFTVERSFVECIGINKLCCPMVSSVRLPLKIAVAAALTES